MRGRRYRRKSWALLIPRLKSGLEDGARSRALLAFYSNRKSIVSSVKLHDVTGKIPAGDA